MEIRGANVVLTGASRGIGAVLADRLAVRGARLALAARSAEELETVRAAAERRGATAIAVPADVTIADDRRRLLHRATEELGSIDVLINNAGIDVWRPFHLMEPEEIPRMVELNLTSLILLTREALPAMLERGRGHVLNMSSTAGKNAVPYASTYAATKHGVVGFTLSLRAELKGTGVSASVVCPGYVKGAGMYEREWQGPVARGTETTVDKVAAAVIRAVEKDTPEIVVSGLLTKVGDVSLAISPRFTNWFAWKMAYPMLRREAERRVREETRED